MSLTTIEPELSIYKNEEREQVVRLASDIKLLDILFSQDFGNDNVPLTKERLDQILGPKYLKKSEEDLANYTIKINKKIAGYVSFGYFYMRDDFLWQYRWINIALLNRNSQCSPQDIETIKKKILAKKEAISCLEVDPY